jgi:hypothetical protein
MSGITQYPFAKLGVHREKRTFQTSFLQMQDRTRTGTPDHDDPQVDVLDSAGPCPFELVGNGRSSNLLAGIMTESGTRISRGCETRSISPTEDTKVHVNGISHPGIPANGNRAASFWSHGSDRVVVSEGAILVALRPGLDSRVF